VPEVYVLGLERGLRVWFFGRGGDECVEGEAGRGEYAEKRMGRVEKSGEIGESKDRRLEERWRE
jgi:hypothetical protein